MTDSEFNTIMHAMVAGIRDDTPVDTGNVRDPATSGKTLSHGRFALTVSVRKAPYFPYVNNYPRHRYRDKNGIVRDGKNNPNYQYFENALDRQIEIIARKAGGYVERG